MNKIRVSGYFYNGIDKNQINFKAEGMKQNNIIKYNYEDEEFIINIGEDRVVFNKKNNTSKLKYIFTKIENNNSFYTTFENNIKIYLKVLTKYIKIKDNTIDIKFMLENYESILHIEYEVI